MSVLWWKLGRDLRARALALLSLVAIIAIGNAAHLAMASVWRDLDGARGRYYAEQRLHDLRVVVERVPARVVASLRRDAQVRDVRGRVAQALAVEIEGRVADVPGLALSLPTPRRPVTGDVAVVSGGWFSGAHVPEAIVIAAFARAHGIRPGDRLAVRLQGQRISVRVVGLAAAPEFVYLLPADGGLAPDPSRFAVLYLPERYLQDLAQLGGAYNQVLVRLWDRRREALDRYLRGLEVRLERFGVQAAERADQEASVRFLADELAGLEVQATVLPGIFLGAAALVLNVMMGRQVRAQRTMIGTLRAIGVGRAALLVHIGAFGAAVGLAGGVAGVFLGLWMQGAMVDIYRRFFEIPTLEAALYTDILVRTLALSVAFALLGSFTALRRVLRLQPAAAMRPPPPERGHHLFLERAPLIWGRLPGTVRMALRSVSRNPYRSAVAVLVSALSTAMILGAMNSVDGIEFLMRHEFVKTAHQDLTVTFAETVDAAGVREVARLPGVRVAEPRLAVPARLQSGPRSRRVNVIGLRGAGHLYTPLDADGRRLPAPGRGLVLAAKLAELMGVQIGDRVLLTPERGRRSPLQLPVTGIAETYLGIAAYADARILARALGERSVATGALVAIAGADVPAALERALARRPAVIGTSERRTALGQLERTFGETMGIMIGVLVMFSGLIAFGAVLTGALVALEERAREVATLRVLGYGSLRIASVFGTEALVLNGLGVALGLYGGVWLSRLLAVLYSTELYRFPAFVAPVNVGLAALAMTGFLGTALLLIYVMIRRQPWLRVLNVQE